MHPERLRPDQSATELRAEARRLHRWHVIISVFAVGTICFGSAGAFFLYPILIPSSFAYGSIAAALFAGASIYGGAAVLCLSQKKLSQPAEQYNEQARFADLFQAFQRASLDGEQMAFLKSIRRMEQKRLKRHKNPIILSPHIKTAEQLFEELKPGINSLRQQRQRKWEKWERKNFGAPSLSNQIFALSLNVARRR